MKRLKKEITYVLFAAAILITPLYADSVGGFVDDQASVKTVSNALFDVITTTQAKTLAEDTYVVLEGHITGSAKTVDPKEYLFKDNSGIIKIEVPANVWQGRKVTPQTKIRILGEIDRNDMTQTVEIEVKKLEIISN